MRKIIIDTDTASDDAVAIIMAMRAKNMHVEALTVVAGNVPLEIALNNALISVDAANTYDVPVYAGAHKPLFRDLETGQFAHGQNGMGDIELPFTTRKPEQQHAVDAMIDIIKNNPYEIDVVAIGPLTNLAMAIQKEPKVMKSIKSLSIMGGNGFGEGNMTDFAEFNYYVDAEAAKIVSDFYTNILLMPWNTCLEGVRFDQKDIDRILSIDSELSKFVIDINRSLLDFNLKTSGIRGFILADPGIIALVIKPELAKKVEDVRTDIIIEKGDYYGQQIVESAGTPNYRICTEFDRQGFMDLMVDLLS